LLAGFGELYGLDRPTAFKLGALLVRAWAWVASAGLSRSNADPGLQGQRGVNGKETRFKVYDLNREFIRLFEQKHGTIICNDLLGVDLNTPEGRDKAVKDGLFRTLCPGLVRMRPRSC